MIAQGQEDFEAALKDPDTLAAVELAEGEDALCEDFGYAALDAYELRMGIEMPTPLRIPQDRIAAFLTDEETKARMPNLCAKYWPLWMQEESDRARSPVPPTEGP